MTAPARALMPNGRLFCSPRGLWDFQGDLVARAYVHGNRIGVIDRGLGKTVISIALACQLFEDGEIDLVVYVAQANKVAVKEIPAEFAAMSALRVHRHMGTGRMERLAKARAAGEIDVLITTYETGAADLMKRVKANPKASGKGGRRDGVLMDALDLRTKRVLWVFDEVIKLSSRRTEVWQSFDYALTQLRRTSFRQRVYGLSANTFSTDEYEESLNIGLIVAPDIMPGIGEFERRFTRMKDDNHRYIYNEAARTEFVPLFQSIIDRKRDSDPDVIDQMPRLMESRWDVKLDPEHRLLYEAIEGLFGAEWSELSDAKRGQLAMCMKIVLGHPRAIRRANGEVAQAIQQAVPASRLAEIPSSKTLRLIEELKTLGGKQALVFTWWADTVLPELLEDLTVAGFSVDAYTGPDAASREAQERFRSGDVQILLSSDAGARGLNLPEARYVIEYEPATTHERRAQRFGRGTRITSDERIVYAVTMVALKTMEVGSLQSALRRNAAQDRLYGDVGAENYVTASERRRTLELSRR